MAYMGNTTCCATLQICCCVYDSQHSVDALMGHCRNIVTSKEHPCGKTPYGQKHPWERHPYGQTLLWANRLLLNLILYFAGTATLVLLLLSLRLRLRVHWQHCNTHSSLEHTERLQ